jgi:hypothetical protein
MCSPRFDKVEIASQCHAMYAHELSDPRKCRLRCYIPHLPYPPPFPSTPSTYSLQSPYSSVMITVPLVSVLTTYFDASALDSGVKNE